MREREGETMILECDECHSDTEILYKVDGQEICADCLSDYLESAERLRTISCSEIRLKKTVAKKAISLEKSSEVKAVASLYL